VLHRVGLRQGDSTLVQSSFDAFEGFDGKPSDVIEVLKDVVGPRGLLMMPTIPFSGTAIEWARSHPLVGVRRTPSRMGLISQIFRRSPNVMRSMHPTHPVTAWGAQAAECMAGHPLARTPCGAGSPYHGLLARDGDVLLLGVDVNADKLTNFLKPLQAIDAEDEAINGAVAGSFPLFGAYMRGGYPNWAPKYLLDALLLQERVRSSGSTEVSKSAACRPHLGAIDEAV
jgi:Aminoglycoside 3-N-acetyltransferase